VGKLPNYMYEHEKPIEDGDPPALSDEEAKRRRLEELKRLVDEDPDDEE
jgi:hypothetical protein